MTEELCPITELCKAWCAHCRKQELPKPAPLQWFMARFEGSCAICHRRIEVGDDIADTDDGYICGARHDIDYRPAPPQDRNQGTWHQ